MRVEKSSTPRKRKKKRHPHNHVQRLIALADSHTLIERGQPVWQGPSADLAAQPGLWQRYIGV